MPVVTFDFGTESPGDHAVDLDDGEDLVTQGTPESPRVYNLFVHGGGTINLKEGSGVTLTLIDDDATTPVPRTVTVEAGALMTWDTLFLGKGADVLTINNNLAIEAHGDVGDDTLNGGGGYDLLNGGDDNDSLVGGLGDDSLYGVSGSDTIKGEGGDDVLLGYTGDDFIFGGDNDDVINGEDGNDDLSGGSGNDTVEGGIGNDFLNGDGGADLMFAGAGNDTYVVDNVSDVIGEGAGGGIDTVWTSFLNYTLPTNLENLTLLDALNLSGTGNGVANVITGNSGNNILMGLAGNDTLGGGAGNDSMIGGAGKDLLTDGGGLDHFKFTTLSDSGTAFPNRDAVSGFAHGDKIDLSGIDANSSAAGNQAFMFVTNFTHVAGQVQWDKVATHSFLITADVNGDGVADWSINLYTSTAFNDHLQSWDFVL